MFESRMTEAGATRWSLGLIAAVAVVLAMPLHTIDAGAADDPPNPERVQDSAEPSATPVDAAGGPETEAEMAEQGAADRAAELAERWGIEVTSIRLTANDHMIDFRYRVLDPEKAQELFVRQNKPALIHQETGRVLAVPETAKTGPLRNSNQPKQGKIYWMFFGNAGFLVQSGDEVTVVIGEFRAEDLVVE